MLIQLRDARRIYEKGGNEIRALDGVSLDIREGEFVSIMGPSGSGKSTLMHLLGCLDRPTGGSYVLDGVRVEGLDDTQLSRIRNSKVGFVFQTFNLLSDLSTVENVGLPLVYAGVDGVDRRDRCANAASAIGLGRRLLHKPTELSGGEVQRVAIARALVNHPKIILADEPTGNLDSRTGQEIMAIFAKLHESGKTVIMVTHDERLARFADRIISLRDGKMVGEEKVESRTRSTFPAPDLKLQEPSAAASPREMSWRDLVRIGLREGLMAHKMRTALTMLGVLFGVSALIAMSSIGEGARREAIEQIRQMGSNNIRVRDLHLTGEELKEARRKLSDGLTLDDASALKQIIPSIQDIASIKELKVAIRLGEKKPKGKVVATAPEYEKVANFHVERGRFITPADMDACARVCVLGKSLKKELFANEEAIGEEIRLGQDRYTVVGVMEGKDIPKGRMKAISTRDLNHDVY
ncbi:MAG: ATP-binding cassette domain-containing protein, partial [Planctomycetes bacterium]|nr:ATP-binding cassette domain-containing protein [Planctomycetota bacterium]